MRAYRKAAFNMVIGILKKEGITDFYNSHARASV